MSQSAAIRAELAREVDRSLPRLVELTQRLVRLASPNPPSDTVAIADVAEAMLAQIPGMEITRVEPERHVISLVGRLRGAAPGRRLIFNGHLDTFPIGAELGWTVDPLGAEMRDGRLYGRGVCDMKGGLACSILAASLLARHKEAWRGEIVLTLAGDEENMGSLGTGFLLERVPYAKGDANICGDVGSPMVVRYGEKGLYWIEVETTGSPSHGAHVHKGVNAIDRLRAALDRLKQLEDMPVAAPAVIGRTIADAKPVSESLSGAGESEVLQKVTVNIGTIAGGVSPNLVPTSAKAAADIRLPVGVGTADLDRQLAALLGPLEGVSWKVTRRFEPNYTDPEHEIVRCVVDAAEEALGRRPAVNMRIGASDSRWYRRHGVPTVVYGLTPHNMGGADEYILVEELAAVAKVHTLAAYDFLTATT